MKKLILTSFIFLSIFFSFNLKQTENPSHLPRVTHGVIDLSHLKFDSTKDSIIPLEGDWEFYWNQLIEDPDEQKVYFRNFKASEIKYIPVPSEWQDYKLDENKLPAKGYAMFRTRVLLPELNGRTLSFFMTDVCTSYSIYINGKFLCLEIYTDTIYEINKSGIGNGTKNISNRLSEINGFSMKCNEEFKYHERIYFPLNKILSAFVKKD